MLYLCSIVVHGEHAEHVQGVSTFDEFPHSVWQDARASLICWRHLVAGWIWQLIHADNTVLRGIGGQGGCVENHNYKMKVCNSIKPYDIPLSMFMLEEINLCQPLLSLHTAQKIKTKRFHEFMLLTSGRKNLKRLPHLALQPLPPCSAESHPQVSEKRLKEQQKQKTQSD